MKRRAMLIDASRATADAIDGCRRDVDRMKSWLVSKAGGAWNADETILNLHNASVDAIERGKEWIEGADFAILAFSGHGYISEDRRTCRQRQVIVIGEGTEYYFDALIPDVEKAIIICDACREVHLTGTQIKAFVENRKYARYATTRYSRADYRRVFWQQVNQCDGHYTIYSCSPGQYSGDDPLNGGRFHDILLSHSGEWHDDSGESGIRTIGEAFSEAAPAVGEASRSTRKPIYPQDPIASSSVRGSGGYPFGICLM